MHDDAMDAMDVCVPYFASNLESEPVSSPDTPVGSAMHCGYAPVVEFGPAVERSILRSVATDASRTPLAGAQISHYTRV